MKRSKIRGRNSGSIPRPLSVTVNRASPRDPSTRRSIVPPRGVNLIAFVSRCQAIWRRRLSSPRTTTGVSGTETLSTTPFARAAESTVASACCAASPSVVGRLSTCSSPVSARETSRRSLVSCAWSRTLRSIASRPRDDVGSIELSGPQQVDPAQHGVERRAQFVGHRREELVLHPVRGFPVAPRRLGDLRLTLGGPPRRAQLGDDGRQQQPLDDEEREVRRDRGAAGLSRALRTHPAPRRAPSRPAPARSRRTTRSP